MFFLFLRLLLTLILCTCVFLSLHSSRNQKGLKSKSSGHNELCGPLISSASLCHIASLLAVPSHLHHYFSVSSNCGTFEKPLTFYCIHYALLRKIILSLKYNPTTTLDRILREPSSRFSPDDRCWAHRSGPNSNNPNHSPEFGGQTIKKRLNLNALQNDFKWAWLQQCAPALRNHWLHG